MTIPIVFVLLVALSRSSPVHFLICEVCTQLEGILPSKAAAFKGGDAIEYFADFPGLIVARLITGRRRLWVLSVSFAIVKTVSI